MAFAYSNPGDGFRSAFDDDKAMFLASNALASANEIRLVQGTGWGDTATYETRPACAVDGRPWKELSIADEGTGLQYSAILQFTTAISMDVAAVQLVEALGVSSTFTIAVANDSSGSPGAFTTIFTDTWSATEMRRAAWFDLTWEHTVVTGIDWLRFSWTGLNDSPQIGQLWGGRRVQLGIAHQLPNDFTPRFSTLVPGAAPGGRVRTYKVDASGHADRQLTYLAENKNDGYSINNFTEVRNIWTDSEFGRRPVLYWPYAGTDLDTFIAAVIVNQPNFSYVGPYHCAPTFELAEIPGMEATE